MVGDDGSLTVFQRTPNLALPMRQRKLTKEEQDEWKANRQELYNSRMTSKCSNSPNYLELYTYTFQHSLVSSLTSKRPQPSQRLQSKERPFMRSFGPRVDLTSGLQPTRWVLSQADFQMDYTDHEINRTCSRTKRQTEQLMISGQRRHVPESKMHESEISWPQ